MSEAKIKTHADFVLPPSVVTKVDISRLVSEVERVDNEMTEKSVREKVGATQDGQVTMSPALTDFLSSNNVSLEHSHDRSDLIKQLRLLKDNVRVIHMTFAVVADHESLQQIVDWVRTTVYAQAVIEVGLQPSLIAGVYLRTPNHVKDLSLRSMFEGRRQILVDQLEAFRASK